MTPTFARTIMHIDFDSFFASVEQQANPYFRNKPLGVTGSSLTRGVVCAASREAKKHGIKTGMPIFKARERCPHIIIITGDFTKYQYIHKKSLEIFARFTDLVEPFSIDEAFIDVTQTQRFFGGAKNIGDQIKSRLRDAFGEYVTCSIGVGPNKLMAKLVSDFNKPNGFFEVTQANIAGVLYSTDLKAFCGIGPQITLRLNNLGIYTVNQLQEANYDSLQYGFGSVCATFLKNTSFGVDTTPVTSVGFEKPVKSVGHQHTLAKNTKDITVIKNNLRRLCEMVGRRLRNQQVAGKTISLCLRDKDMRNYRKSATVQEPVDNGLEVFTTAEKLLDSEKWLSVINKEIRLVGVSVSNILPKRGTAAPLFAHDVIRERITNAYDLINNKFGEFTLVPANTLLADRTKGKISSFLKH